MGVFAAVDVSQQSTAVCVVDASGAILAEAKVATCPEAISHWLGQWSGTPERIGMETGPLAVWLWNAVVAKGLPIVVLDARHANAAPEMMPNKTDRHDARRCSSAGAYLGLTPKRHQSGEISRNGRISTCGDRMARRYLDEAANALTTRNLGGSGLRDRARAIAKRTGPRTAKVALARKLAVMLHAMWRTDSPFANRLPA